jgi:4,5-dihydroxyphthalate decarboxylase
VASTRGAIRLSLAINDYDHVRDLAGGAVAVEGVELTCLHFGVEEIFFRFTHHREWDVSELSLAKFSSLRASGDTSLVGIPVFPSRAFRHSAIFVAAGGPVDDPSALAGGRIGVPEWTQTATVYGRGLLEHQYGVGLRDVEWVQGGTNEPGRTEGLKVAVPDGVRVTPVADRSLNDLLLAGEIDAIIAAHPPAAFKDGSGRIVRLFSDYRPVEEAYFAQTGVFPIMHVIAIRSEVYERDRWIAMNLYTAFEEAKARSLARALDANAPRFPVPWGPAHTEQAAATIGADFWPYGLGDTNRTTLDTFLGLAHEQGVCATRLSPDELFVAETATAFRI